MAALPARCLAQLLSFATAAALCTTLPAPAPAQTAPVFLEPGHWSYAALRRLSAAGLTPAASDPAAAAVTVQHARRVFAAAADSAAALGRTGLAQLAAGYGMRLAAEADSAGRLAGLQISAGWMAASGEARGGDGYFIGEDWQGARPLPAWSGPAGGVRAHGYPLSWLAWSGHGRRTAAEWSLSAASLAVVAGAFDIWAGRRRIHYGSGHGGGTVLASGLGDVPELAHRTLATVDGLGVQLREPVRLPGFLSPLGSLRIEVAGGRIPASGRVARPYVVFGRFTTTPLTDRWLLGVNRGAIFGGEGNPVTAGRLLGLLIGLHGGEAGEFENQVFSVVSRFRPPLGSLAAEIHAEVGMDDTAGAISSMPGIVAGVELGALPGAPAAALGIEHTQYPRSCCGNPIWYRSIFFRGSWSDEGRLFAHPLGGHGREWLAHGRLDLPGAGVLLRTDAFVRRRGHENLFAPEREGRSVGGSGGLEVRPGGSLTINVDAGIERGRGWRTSRLSAMLSRTFGAEAR
jgi:hypothetical protein